MRFRFLDSGGLAFTDPTCTTAPLLLVTDDGNDAVHVIDVGARAHTGYVGALGSIPGPRGVAARGSLVAVSCWKEGDCGEHVVRVFEGSGADWAPLRVLGGGFGLPGAADGQLKEPYGLRFTGDGRGVAVVDVGNGRVSLFTVFSVGDGSFVRQLASGLRRPWDVEECEGGWLVVCRFSCSVEFVGGDGAGQATLGERGSGDGEFYGPTALALVPGLGLVVREFGNDGRLQVFATPDAIAMAAMSGVRVAWMVAAARGVARRRSHLPPSPRLTLLLATPCSVRARCHVARQRALIDGDQPCVCVCFYRPACGPGAQWARHFAALKAWMVVQPQHSHRHGLYRTTRSATRGRWSLGWVRSGYPTAPGGGSLSNACTRSHRSPLAGCVCVCGGGGGGGGKTRGIQDLFTWAYSYKTDTSTRHSHSAAPAQGTFWRCSRRDSCT